MRSTVLRSPRAAAFFALAGSVAFLIAVLGAAPARAQAPEEEADRSAVSEAQVQAAKTGPNPFAARFPDVVLKSHEGRNVRFYEDLLEGKIVLINFMYATCTER